LPTLISVSIDLKKTGKKFIKKICHIIVVSTTLMSLLNSHKKYLYSAAVVVRKSVHGR